MNKSSNYPDWVCEWNVMDMYDELVSSEITNCGHDVSSDVLSELGYKDFFGAKCHHCLHYDGDISDKEYEKLCEKEKVI